MTSPCDTEEHNCFEDGPPWDGEICYICLRRARNDELLEK
jgi:hypothetical protein